jgi:hypothetical protein
MLTLKYKNIALLLFAVFKYHGVYLDGMIFRPYIFYH